MKTVGVRELKDRLSRYLDEVRHGEVVLITDRGTVIAEIRQPNTVLAGLSPFEQRLQPYVEQGIVSPAVPHDPKTYARPSFSMPETSIDAALAAARDDHQ
jgi:antitoxin (DNA-binding transcriptional repressor) of toxin-antitoxin stability system